MIIPSARAGLRAARRWPAMFLAFALASAAVSGLPSCATEAPVPRPRPEAGVSRNNGDTVVQTKAYYGIPILQKSFFWDGNGETDDFGVGVHAAHFLADDLAIGGGLNLGTWLVPGANRYSGELEGLMRWYPFDGGPLFFDLTAGYQQSNDPVPPGGTEWNFTFSFGPVLDLPLDKDLSLLVGTTYHHISNALGRMNDRNPSQNEARLWLGFAWTL